MCRNMNLKKKNYKGEISLCNSGVLYFSASHRVLNYNTTQYNTMPCIKAMKYDETDRKLLSFLSNQTGSFPGKDLCFLLN